MKIKLNNVRLSFPSLFQKANFNGDVTKYEATFLIDKESQAALVSELGGAIKELIKVNLKGAKLGPDKICLKDGEEIGYEGYDGCWSIKSSNAKRPMTLARDKSPVTADDDVFYSGCYVNAVVELWAQDNNYGKRINATLLGVQFFRDGQPLGGGSSASLNDFAEVDGDDFDSAMGF